MLSFFHEPITPATGTVCEVRTFSAPGVASAPQVTWPQPSARETRLAAALDVIAGEAGIRAPDHILVVSDGGVPDRTRSSAAPGALREAGIAVSAKATGIDQPARNASLNTVRPPRVARPGARIVLPVELSASGCPAGAMLRLMVRDEAGTEAGRQEIQLPANDGGAVSVSAKVSFEASLQTGAWTLELTGPAGEVTLDDAAGGGSFLTTPEDAATASRATVQARAGRDFRTFPQPVWSIWPVRAALLILLGLEWLVRRHWRHAAIPALNSEPIPAPA